MSQMTKEDEELLRRVFKEELEKLLMPIIQRIESLEQRTARIHDIATQLEPYGSRQ